MYMRAMSVVASMVLLTMAGCGWRKQHLTRAHGESYDGAFAAQRERVGKAPAVAVTGLDAQEAAIISDGYRRGLAPKGSGSAKQESIILMAPPSTNQSYKPAPSVPKE